MPVPACYELGIPSVYLFRTLLLTRFYAHLSSIPPHRPASILHHMQKAVLERPIGPSGLRQLPYPTQHKQYFDVSIKSALNSLQLPSQWQSISLQLPYGRHHQFPPKMKTIEKAWMKKWISPALLTLQQKEFDTWKNAPKQQDQMSRGFTYHHYTTTDRHTAAHHKRDIFSPAPYLKFAHSNLAAMQFLRIRLQISVLPTHNPHEFDMMSESANIRTAYPFRYCTSPTCSLPPDQWGTIHPAYIYPPGNEAHYILQCPAYAPHRLTCSRLMDEALSKIHHNLPNKEHPWSALPDAEKITSLLCALPPPSWGLPASSTAKWLQESSPIIYAFWQPLLQEQSKIMQIHDILHLPFQSNPHAASPV